MSASNRPHRTTDSSRIARSAENQISPEASATLAINDERRVDMAEFGPYLVVCLRHLGSYSAVGPTWDNLSRIAADNHLIGPMTHAIGITYDSPEDTPADRVRYDACLSIVKDYLPRVPLEPGADRTYVTRIESLQRMLCWRTTHRGDYSGLASAYREVLESGVFAENSMIGPATEGPYYEIYHNSPALSSAADLVVDVYFPLERKETSFTQH
ncbi:MAG: AraC family transcriptional regulator [Pseudonocardiaceae bacterium]